MIHRQTTDSPSAKGLRQDKHQNQARSYLCLISDPTVITYLYRDLKERNENFETCLKPNRFNNLRKHKFFMDLVHVKLQDQMSFILPSAFEQSRHFRLTWSATNTNSAMCRPQKQDNVVRNVQIEVKERVSKHMSQVGPSLFVSTMKEQSHAK